MFEIESGSVSEHTAPCRCNLAYPQIVGTSSPFKILESKQNYVFDLQSAIFHIKPCIYSCNRRSAGDDRLRELADLRDCCRPLSPSRARVRVRARVRALELELESGR